MRSQHRRQCKQQVKWGPRVCSRSWTWVTGQAHNSNTAIYSGGQGAGCAGGDNWHCSGRQLQQALHQLDRGGLEQPSDRYWPIRTKHYTSNDFIDQSEQSITHQMTLLTNHITGYILQYREGETNQSVVVVSDQWDWPCQHQLPHVQPDQGQGLIMKMAAINNIGTGDYHEYADMVKTLDFDPVFIPEVSIKQGEGSSLSSPSSMRRYDSDWREASLTCHNPLPSTPLTPDSWSLSTEHTCTL